MLLVAVATAVAVWLVPSDDVEVVDLPPSPPAETAVPEPQVPPPASVTAPPAPVIPGAPGATARALIAAQRQAGKPDPKAAYLKARELANADQTEDAYLLDFYAARLGHADAAFLLGEQADPVHWQAGGMLQAPAPEQALKWYRAAANVGHAEAEQRLAALRAWADAAAQDGDADAQRLMLAW